MKVTLETFGVCGLVERLSIGLALDNTSTQQEEQAHPPSIQKEEQVSQEGREVPLSSIRQEEQAPLTSIQQEEQVHPTSIQQKGETKLWSDKLIAYLGWWRRRGRRKGWPEIRTGGRKETGRGRQMPRSAS